MRPIDLLDNLAGAAAIAGTVVLSPLLRRAYARWGAHDEELAEPLPGDAIVVDATLRSTRAIDIAAEPADVWPWLVQLGQGRGGLYSYQGLENLAGCRITNAEQILPEHQQLAIGDSIRMGPPGYPLFRVAALAPGQHLVLQALDPRTGAPGDMSWAFVLRPTARGCRLLVRGRINTGHGLGAFMLWRVATDPIWFVMERRMLLGIRARAERPRKSRTCQGCVANAA